MPAVDRKPAAGPLRSIRNIPFGVPGCRSRGLATETEMSMQHTAESKSDLDILLQLKRDYIRSVQTSDVGRLPAVPSAYHGVQRAVAGVLI